MYGDENQDISNFLSEMGAHHVKERSGGLKPVLGKDNNNLKENSDTKIIKQDMNKAKYVPRDLITHDAPQITSETGRDGADLARQTGRYATDKPVNMSGSYADDSCYR